MLSGRIVLFPGVAALALTLAGPLMAQEAGRDFVPNQLVIGFENQEDRDKAIGELKQNAPKVRGLFNPEKMQAQPLGDNALMLDIVTPKTRGAIAPADRLRVLREHAEQYKRSNPRVKYAHPNWIMRIKPPKPAGGQPAPERQPEQPQPGGEPGTLKPQSAPAPDMPNDPIFVRGLHWDYQPPPAGMNAAGAWRKQKGSRDIVVAVLDTGIAASHPDIQGGANLLPGYNFVSARGNKRGPDATDPGEQCDGEAPSWHGTHVAGTVGAAKSNNGAGIAGVAWNVSVLPVRVLGCGGGSVVDLAAAMRWAAGLDVPGVPKNPHPAHVINMSLGAEGACNYDDVALLVDAVSAVRAAGAVVVVAAGNETVDIKNYWPAGCKDVISVAAGDHRGRLAPYSNYGAVTLMAPGGDTGQTDKNGAPLGVWSTVGLNANAPEGVEPMQGTSMAAPHVAGALALALAAHPEWRRKPALIESKLRSCLAKTQPGACGHPCGAGQLDAEKLISCP